MPRQMLLTAQRTCRALLLAALIIIPTATLRAQSTEELTAAPPNFGGGILDVLDLLRQAQAQRLEGSWILTINAVLPPGAPPRPASRAYLTASRGGAAIGSNRNNPFALPQHGAWVHLGGDEFAYNMIEEQFDATGTFVRVLRVRTKINLTGPDTLVGVAATELRNPAGDLLSTGCATFRGERIKVEPLTPQCQSITPPQ